MISTDIDTFSTRIKTYQYSVKELSKYSEGGGGIEIMKTAITFSSREFLSFLLLADSHEMAGIFFKYDVNPLKIVIREEDYTILQLILRVFGCAGGLYIVTGTSTFF